MTNVSYDFTGYVAIITGGSNGIGAEIARHYHEAGATVQIWDRSAPTELDIPHQYYSVDVASPDQIEAATQSVLDRHGKIDFLSHNVGYAGSTLPTSESDPAEWTNIIDVNLNGTYRLCRAVVPAMQQNGFGRIINMASLASKEGTPNASAYRKQSGSNRDTQNKI